MAIKKYLNPRNYLLYFINKFSPILATLEKRLIDKYSNKEIYPPVFIIGAPRSGSTLLYKLLTERYKFSYFSNFSSMFYETPVLGTLIQKKLRIKASKSEYTFNYGRVNGLGSPSECGEFWYRWFPKGMHVYVPHGKTSFHNLEELRNEISGMSKFTDAPMIFKNLYNSMRIAPIVESMPNALFVVCRRNHLNNSLSILNGRITNLKQKDKWWSLPPKEIDLLLGLPYSAQVTGQVFYTYKQIEADKKRYGKDRFLEIHYEDLCSNVYKILKKIEQFIDLKGYQLQVRSDVPVKFRVMEVKGLDLDDRKLVEKAINNFWQEEYDQ